MTRAIINSIDGAFWDFVYQAVLITLGVAATGAVFLALNGL